MQLRWDRCGILSSPAGNVAPSSVIYAIGVIKPMAPTVVAASEAAQSCLAPSGRYPAWLRLNYAASDVAHSDQRSAELHLARLTQQRATGSSPSGMLVGSAVSNSIFGDHPDVLPVELSPLIGVSKVLRDSNPPLPDCFARLLARECFLLGTRSDCASRYTYTP
ncbi:MAG: hypothetical protein [Podoviridae sp. ctda_1]|nr:MAG: hypothetical protein [Podoviridae sp. ctda_1]